MVGLETPSNGRVDPYSFESTLRSLALRYECSRISGFYLLHRLDDAGPRHAANAQVAAGGFMPSA